MKKRDTFVERQKLLKNGSSHVLMRSAESDKKCTDGQRLVMEEVLRSFTAFQYNKQIIRGFECLPSQQKVREAYRGTRINMPAGSQHMKTVHISKSMISAPFLQHPALTAGQRCYLCSIANVYSTEHIRQQMKQHYLKVLHACVQSGENPTCRRRYWDHRHTFPKDAEKDAMRGKPQRQSKCKGSSSNSSTADSNVILPKIVNR